MPVSAYPRTVSKPLYLADRGIKTPPFSREARIEAGRRLRELQEGAVLSMPHSRPMPSVGRNVHELRIQDGDLAWRIVYAVREAILILAVFEKKTRKAPKSIIENCRRRLKRFDQIVES